MDTFITDLMKGFTGSLDEYAKELDKRIKTVMKRKWRVGFRDRGMGRGDFAVLAEFKGCNIVIAECSCREVAVHICKLHKPLSYVEYTKF